MRHRHIFRAAAVAGVSTLAVVAGLTPADAADTTETTTTYSPANGALYIVAPATSTFDTTNWGAVLTYHVFGNVTVHDERGFLVAGWTVSASTTGFSNATHTITATDITYNAGKSTTQGVVFPIGFETRLSSTPKPVVTATGGGSSIATWRPTVAITLPANNVGGTVYSGEIVHSIA